MLGELFSFLWRNAPKGMPVTVGLLAVATGLSRDGMLWVTNAAARAVAGPDLFRLWLPIFGVAIAAYAVLHLVYPVMTQALVARMAETLRGRLTGNLLKATPLFVQTHQHGSLYHVITTDVQVATNISRTLFEFLPATVFLIVAVPQIFVLSPAAGIFAVVVMSGGLLSYYVQRRTLAGMVKRIRELDIHYFERVADIIGGFRELKLHRPRRTDLQAEIDRTVGDVRDLAIRTERRYSVSEATMQTLKYVLFGGVVFIVPLLGDRDPTTAFQVLTVVLFSLGPFEEVVKQIPAVMRAMVSFRRIEELDAELAQFASVDEGEATSPPPFHRLTLEGVTARYSVADDHGFELGPLDFELRRGEIVLVVGDNGSGKTTFLNVLAGLLDIESGRILVDGVPVEDRDRNAYRERFSAIFTVFHLFYRLFGLGAVDRDEARTLLRRLDLDGVTDYAEGGFTRLDLSSGQRRRVALAVVLLEKRDIVILDEFVADQDPGKREFFFRVLLPEMKAAGKTVVITTHDLAWVPFCDRLVRFSGGRIASIDENPGRAAMPATGTGP